jgi:hypothetical protein
MKLTSERGRNIREEYSNEKEKEICDDQGLVQIGGTKTKIDGTNGDSNVSIKNFSGNSSQVHLTTQKRFIEVLELDDEIATFVKMFCGDDSLNIKGKDRYDINDINNINPKIVNSFLSYLSENTTRIIDLIISNGFNITKVVYRNLKTNEIYGINYVDIMAKVENCKWVAKKGGIHLKDENGKSYFHFQREGKKNKNNRYNVLWHIHRHLFMVN